MTQQFTTMSCRQKTLSIKRCWVFISLQGMASGLRSESSCMPSVIPRLAQLAEYIYRNLTFAEHIALMGLEHIGYAPRNMHELWIDPYDYQDQLESAVEILSTRGMNVSIYNLQLCVLRRVALEVCPEVDIGLEEHLHRGMWIMWRPGSMWRIFPMDHQVA